MNEVDETEVEKAFRAGFEAGELFNATNEVGCRHSSDNVDEAWKRYQESDEFNSW
jgi:hypothetical protein